MKLTLSAPGKTFLVGEYAVMAGGSALLLNTEPRFELLAAKGAGKLTGIPVGSPAYRWCEQHAKLLGDWDIEFRDPHVGAGGFGASGAQFLFVHSLTTFLQASVGRALRGLDLPGILADFKKLSEGRASGADVLSLAVGGVAKLEDGVMTSSPWPFAGLDFAIVRTGKKIPTHEHLRDLDHAKLEAVLPLAAAVVAQFTAANETGFLTAVESFSGTLRNLGLLAEHSASLLEKLSAEPWCLAAKGCGALGADTMLLFFKPENLAAVKAKALALELEFSASSATLSPGLKMDWSWT